MSQANMAARAASDLQKETDYFNSPEGKKERELEFCVLEAEALKRRLGLEGRKRSVSKKERKREDCVIKRGAEAMLELEELRKKKKMEEEAMKNRMKYYWKVSNFMLLIQHCKYVNYSHGTFKRGLNRTYGMISV
jgi:hypothetical protein